MFGFLKTPIYLIVLLIAVRLSAQEKTAAPSRQTQAAVEKSSQAPGGAVKAVPEPSGAAKAKPGDAATDTKSSKAPPDSSASAQGAGAEPRVGPGVKRDPFRPFTLNVRPTARRRENLAPLERFELGQLKLVAVIWDVKEPKAMVEDSAGLGYVVKVGTPIGVNDGKVKTIKPNGIMVEEYFVDLYGAKKRHDVEVRLSVEKSE
ncbi:MAG: pilus assembly protein PilP [Deltaproteobacteria bacterium]|nr:pilus assembly protein PilP [Deltaproteobacteria bacterium]